MGYPKLQLVNTCYSDTFLMCILVEVLMGRIPEGVVKKETSCMYHSISLILRGY
jgi:hypothetical protein